MNNGGRRLRPHVLAELLARFKRHRATGKGIMESAERVGLEMGIDKATVYSAQNRLQPSTDLAQDILKAGAAKMAMRIVRKASVDQAVDVLSRPNIGVLAPVRDSGAGGPAFAIGIHIDSLGAVEVTGQQPQAALPAHSVIDYTEPSGLTDEPISRPEPGGESEPLEAGVYVFPEEGVSFPLKKRARREKPPETLPELPAPMPFVARKKVTVEAHQRLLKRQRKSEVRKERDDARKRRNAILEEIEKRRG